MSVAMINTGMYECIIALVDDCIRYILLSFVVKMIFIVIFFVFFRFDFVLVSIIIVNEYFFFCFNVQIKSIKIFFLLEHSEVIFFFTN